MTQLSEKQELILYRLAIRQDEQSRETAHVRMVELETSELYQELLESEYLTFSKFGEGDKAIAQLIVTLKGERYCCDNLDKLTQLDKETWVKCMPNVN